MSNNAGSRAQVEKKTKRASLKEQHERENLRKTVETYEGRAVVWRILERCGIYSASFMGDGYTEFREGKRSIGLWILTELHAYDPNVYLKMQAEAARREADGL